MHNRSEHGANFAIFGVMLVTQGDKSAEETRDAHVGVVVIGGVVPEEKSSQQEREDRDRGEQGEQSQQFRVVW